MKSGNMASKRLKSVINHDREVLSPGSFRVLKKEIGTIVAKYLDIDKRKIKVILEQKDDENYSLIADLKMKEKILKQDK